MSDKNAAAIERANRGFACWAARRAWQMAECCPCEEVVLAVEAYLRGEIEFASVRAAREAAAGGVGGAGIIGVPRAMPSAAAQVAAWHTADDSAEAAARQVIHHAAAVAGFTALEQAADSVGLGPSELASSWRNYYVWRREPQLEATERSREQAFLEGELQRWLKEATNGGGNDDE